MSGLNQTNVIENTAMCNGCFTCAKVCPSDAIFVYEDKRGHIYPKIDKDKCVNCNKCRKVCPAVNTYLKDGEIAFYGVRHNRADIVAKSSSGGLFAGLAEVIFSMGGVCYGAAYEADFSVAHKRAADSRELYALQGSKYAISNTGDTFKQVDSDLKKGIPVLYSGTSCIIAGLYSYLKCVGTDISNLYTCDLICSGVPGNKILKEYVSVLEQKEKSKCVFVNLRDKSAGWVRGKALESYNFENGNKVSNQVYSELYTFRVMNRENCFDCPYIKPAVKCADITMGDFWGLCESTSKTFFDDKGCSLAIVHSEKGMKLLKNGDFRMFRIETSEEAMRYNRTEQHKKIRQHEKFWYDYEKRGLHYCIKKYTSYGGFLTRLRRKALMTLKRW